MKKSLIIAISAVLAGLFVTGCNHNTGNPHVAQTVDYRIKDAAGNAVARAAEDEDPSYDFSYKLLESLPNFNGDAKMSYIHYKAGNKTITETSGENFDLLKNAISFEDCEEGIKFKFTKPEDYDNVTYIGFQLVDKNGQRSTTPVLENSFYEGKDNLEIIFPLVIAGQKANFWVMLDNGNDAQPAAYFFYEVWPAHGNSYVEALQEDYEETDYISIDDGCKMSLHKVIPPKTIKPLKHGITLFEQDGEGPAWVGGEVNRLYGTLEEASEVEVQAGIDGVEADYVLDLKAFMTEEHKLNEPKGFSHIFVEFNYTFEMEDVPGYTFATPAIKPVPVENELFE